MVEGIHYGGGISSVGGGYSVQMCHTVSKEEAHHQYGGGKSSVWWRARSMDLSHHRY